MTYTFKNDDSFFNIKEFRSNLKKELSGLKQRQESKFSQRKELESFPSLDKNTSQPKSRKFQLGDRISTNHNPRFNFTTQTPKNTFSEDQSKLRSNSFQKRIDQLKLSFKSSNTNDPTISRTSKFDLSRPKFFQKTPISNINPYLKPSIAFSNQKKDILPLIHDKDDSFSSQLSSNIKKVSFIDRSKEGESQRSNFQENHFGENIDLNSLNNLNKAITQLRPDQLDSLPFRLSH